MIVPGPKVTFSLQEPTETRTGTGGASETWATVTTFRGSLRTLKTSEAKEFDRETVRSTHKSIIGYEEIGDSFATDLKEENQLVLANTENALSSETFAITGVEPKRLWGNKIATFEVLLEKVV